MNSLPHPLTPDSRPRLLARISARRHAVRLAAHRTITNLDTTANLLSPRMRAIFERWIYTPWFKVEQCNAHDHELMAEVRERWPQLARDATVEHRFTDAAFYYLRPKSVAIVRKLRLLDELAQEQQAYAELSVTDSAWLAEVQALEDAPYSDPVEAGEPLPALRKSAWQLLSRIQRAAATSGFYPSEWDQQVFDCRPDLGAEAELDRQAARPFRVTRSSRRAFAELKAKLPWFAEAVKFHFAPHNYTSYYVFLASFDGYARRQLRDGTVEATQ